MASTDDGPVSARSPAVSVCVPLYQKRAYIGDTVRSVLSQTFTDFELVVLDNASRDGSGDVVKAFDDPRIVLRRNDETISGTDNFNRVVELSRAPLVKVLPADDLIHPTCLERQVAAFDAQPDLAMVTCRQDMIDDTGAILARDRCLRTPDLVGLQDRATVLRRVVRHGGNPVGNPGNVLFRRSAFEAAGGFPTDEDFFTADVSMWLRLLGHGRYLGLPETLTSFRIDGGSHSIELRREAIEIQRRFVTDLRRANAGTVRRRDVLFAALRRPLTTMRHHLLFAAGGSDDSLRTRAAVKVLGIGSRTTTDARS
jgi:glycosyltransferase involved in cell wall biosynthesis